MSCPTSACGHFLTCLIRANNIDQAIEGSDGNDVFHLLPKFHPELNPIEYWWGWSKCYFQEHLTGNFVSAKSLVPKSLDACPLITIRHFFCRADWYANVYSLGATGIAAEYAVKKYKSHRTVSQCYRHKMQCH
jgi:hypothetical protein